MSANKKARRRWIAAFLALAIVVCGVIIYAVQSADPRTTILEVDGFAYDPVMLADGTIYYLYFDPSDSGPNDTRRIEPSGRDTRFELSATPSCNFYNVNSLRRLPDGGLGAVGSCGEGIIKDPTVAVSIDPTSGSTTQLATAYGAFDVVWLAGLELGWAEFVGSDCHSLTPISRSALLSAPALADGGLLDWRLDRGFASKAFPSEECEPFDRAGFPDVSRSGLLYFLASPQSQISGSKYRQYEQRNVPWNLYAFDPRREELRLVATDLVNPGGLAVSASEDQIFVSCKRGGEDGLWAIDVGTGAGRKLASGDFGAISAPPGRDFVVAIYGHSAIVRVDTA